MLLPMHQTALALFHRAQIGDSAQQHTMRGGIVVGFDELGNDAKFGGGAWDGDGRNRTQPAHHAHALADAAIELVIELIEPSPLWHGALLGFAELEPIVVVGEPRFVVAPSTHDRIAAAQQVAIVRAKDEDRISQSGVCELAMRQQRRGAKPGDDLAAGETQASQACAAASAAATPGTRGAALEAAGVIFLEPKANKDGGAGVRLKK